MTNKRNDEMDIDQYIPFSSPHYVYECHNEWSKQTPKHHKNKTS